MSEQEYENLWHYSEQFTRDPIQRSELVTMAYVMGKKKMGDKVDARYDEECHALPLERIEIAISIRSA